MAQTQISIPDDAWEETGPHERPWARLSLPSAQHGIVFNGLAMYTEAWSADDIDTAFETITIRGRKYVIVIVPYSRS